MSFFTIDRISSAIALYYSTASDPVIACLRDASDAKFDSATSWFFRFLLYNFFSLPDLLALSNLGLPGPLLTSCTFSTGSTVSVFLVLVRGYLVLVELIVH